MLWSVVPVNSSRISRSMPFYLSILYIIMLCLSIKLYLLWSIFWPFPYKHVCQRKLEKTKKKRHFLKHAIALIKDIMKLGFHWEVFSGFGLTITTYSPPWSHQLIEGWRTVLAAAWSAGYKFKSMSNSCTLTQFIQHFQGVRFP